MVALCIRHCLPTFSKSRATSERASSRDPCKTLACSRSSASVLPCSSSTALVAASCLLVSLRSLPSPSAFSRLLSHHQVTIRSQGNHLTFELQAFTRLGCRDGPGGQGHLGLSQLLGGGLESPLQLLLGLSGLF